MWMNANWTMADASTLVSTPWAATSAAAKRASSSATTSTHASTALWVSVQRAQCFCKQQPRLHPPTWHTQMFQRPMHKTELLKIICVTPTNLDIVLKVSGGREILLYFFWSVWFMKELLSLCCFADACMLLIALRHEKADRELSNKFPNIHIQIWGWRHNEGWQVQAGSRHWAFILSSNMLWEKGSVSRGEQNKLITATLGSMWPVSLICLKCLCFVFLIEVNLNASTFHSIGSWQAF